MFVLWLDLQLKTGSCSESAILNRPAEHGSVGFRLLLVRHGADVQRGQVHAEQLCDPLSAIDVTVFVQHLKNEAKFKRTWTVCLILLIRWKEKNTPFFSQTCPSSCLEKCCRETKTNSQTSNTALWNRLPLETEIITKGVSVESRPTADPYIHWSDDVTGFLRSVEDQSVPLAFNVIIFRLLRHINSIKL